VGARREAAVAVDTLLVCVGIHDDFGDAEADPALVGDLHTEAGSSGADDAPGLERDAAGA
jgi:hypothetical protein